jgi:hypothetical protein
MIGKLLRLACFGLVFATAQQSQAGPCHLWHNGDPDLVTGLANELNTDISDARVYEDFIVTPNCSIICAVYSNNFMDFTATTAAWEIRTGVGPGTGGTLVASGTGAATQTLNGFDNPLVPEGYTIMVSGLNVALTPGTYWLSVAPIGQGFGRSFVQSTSGANAVGAPIQNDSAIFDSSFFGYSWAPSDLGFGLPRNYSMGVYAVPEPSSVIILGIGGGLLGLNLVRRKRAK